MGEIAKMSQLKTTIYIVRHGQTEWNVAHRMQGHQDSPLTELGIRQAEWLGESMKDEKIDIIYSSSSPRARRTAELIRNTRDIHITESDELKEIHLGVWEGRTQAEVKAEHPEQFQHFWEDPKKFSVPDCETFQAASERAIRQLQAIIKEHRGKTVLIVTHTVIVKLLMSYFEDRPMKQLWNLPYIYPACLCKVEIGQSQPKIILHGDISHYAEKPDES